MQPHTPPAASDTQVPFRWTRTEIVNTLDHFAQQDTTSQRDFAQQHDIPHATFNYWLQHYAPGQDADPIDSFFASEPGLLLLRRLLCAVVVVFQHQGACGIRLLSQFLHVTQLDRYVASSRGTLHPLVVQIEDDLVAFRDLEQPRLAAQMTPTTITVIADENFHGPQNCLVAIEPLSNFLLVECYRDHRDADTWTTVLKESLHGMPVQIVQLTSDQARGLLCCAEKGLHVTHSPDLFHGQRDLLQPMILPLNRPIQQAEKELEKAQEQTDKLEQSLAESCTKEQLNALIDAVRADLLRADELAEAKQQKDDVVQQVRGIGDDYHPFDRHSGQALTASEVGQRLNDHLDKLQAEVTKAGLPEKAHQAVTKCRSWVKVLMGCVAWFWTMAKLRIEALGLSEEQERQVYEKLLPGCYWERASRRGRTGSERRRLGELAARLKREAWEEGSALASLDAAARKEVLKVARATAGLFQRSSSCVEGRNGRLSLQHHGHSRIGDRRLQALTVIHNYLVPGRDGTTAAERFFGQKPQDVFGWLLAHMPDLPRPAQKRQKTAA